MRDSQFFYLIAKLVNKGQVDWENDRDFTDAERAAIGQAVRELAFYSPYQRTEQPAGERASPHQSKPDTVEAGAKRKPGRPAAGS